jgi:Uma2 family endonuclease
MSATSRLIFRVSREQYAEAQSFATEMNLPWSSTLTRLLTRSERGVCFASIPMQTDIVKKLFTVDEYHRMGEAGILTEDDRVELIKGEIVQMSPIGNRHMVCVDRAMYTLISTLKNQAHVSIQNPLQLDDYSEPQPDVIVLKPRADYYAGRTRAPSDVLLMIEVSDTTLRYDCNIKVPLYAASGVSEVWVEDLQNDVILVYRDPAGPAYKTTFTRRHEETISPLAFPSVAFTVADFLG